MTFQELFPHLAPWVANLQNVWPAPIVKPNFAAWEVLHILSLIVLGGCAILVGVRLIGSGVTEEPPSEVYRNLRWVLHAGVAGIIVSGVLIGMANADRLYNSAAFLVKMLALLSGVIFTYGVTRSTALADGGVSPFTRGAAVLALSVYGVGLWVFLTGGLIMPGLFHVLTAAVLILTFVLKGRSRWVFAGGVAAILAAFFVATHVVITPDDLARSDPANLTIAWVLFVWVFGTAVFHALRGRAEPRSGVLTQVVGYATILIWVTAAAAGRWIAFA